MGGSGVSCFLVHIVLSFTFINIYFEIERRAAGVKIQSAECTKCLNIQVNPGRQSQLLLYFQMCSFGFREMPHGQQF